LERLEASEAYPNWAIKLLTEHYRAELAALVEARKALDLGNASGEEQALEVRRLALLAEKGALNEAERRGRLDEEDWRHLAARIDFELTALATGREVPPKK
jgi:hypothetical protein